MIEENPKYKGIGGWLLLFCIVLTIITPILSASQIVSGYVNTPITNSTVKAALIIESGIGGLLHFYGFVTGCIVWSGNKNGAVYAKRFLIINIIGFFAIATSVALLFDSPEARHKVIGSYILLIPKEIAFFTIWWFYFKYSKRIKFLYENH
jgi:hypothetical protein